MRGDCLVFTGLDYYFERTGDGAVRANGLALCAPDTGFGFNYSYNIAG